MSIKDDISRAANRLYVKYIVPKKEASFKAPYANREVHYLFFKKSNSRTLIVCFQAFNEEGPRYNYVTSLSGLAADRLYIKDDFVALTGNYYMGSGRKYDDEIAVFSLINKITAQKRYSKLIFIGSSKGGYAALNFGLHYFGSTMIVAAPQYYLGAYMTDATKFHTALEDILGSGYTEEDVKELDERLYGKIIHSDRPMHQKVYIHCSVNESTYERHCKSLIEDLEKSGRDVTFDRGEYENHWELKKYFPEYLRKTLKKEVV